MTEYMEILYAALTSDYGVVVECTHTERIRQKLYAARREAQDPALEALSICFSPTNPAHLWIVKRTK